jgi:hypothetical protein
VNLGWRFYSTTRTTRATIGGCGCLSARVEERVKRVQGGQGEKDMPSGVAVKGGESGNRINVDDKGEPTNHKHFVKSTQLNLYRN